MDHQGSPSTFLCGLEKASAIILKALDKVTYLGHEEMGERRGVGVGGGCLTFPIEFVALLKPKSDF